MQLSELLEGIKVEIKDPALIVEGICSNSKQVQKNDLFIARTGRVFKGDEFLKEALERGARAILTDQKTALENEAIIYVQELEKIEGLLAARFYQHPSKKLKMIALTGTNGKTTTSYLIRQMLGEKKCGLIGTIEYLLGKEKIEASLTTPDVTSNHRMLSKMLENGLKYAVMEATSVALTQNRLNSIDFDLALFTNFSQDHLDYHHTMEKYLAAKISLFERLPPSKMALLNADMKEVNQVISRCSAHIITYGIHEKADLKATQVVLDASRTSFELSAFGKTYLVESQLIGLYNVYNVLAALSVFYALGLDLQLGVDQVRTLTPPAGRLQKVPNPIGAEIFVDFAHTEDALRNVLLTLQKIKKGRLITVFGCGGDRDPQKRPLMGRVVSSLSDFTLITSDNPRGEDPEKICFEILKGCSGHVTIEVDRKKAIQKAIELLKPHDVLLIAGRGHEKYQKIQGQDIPFEDTQETLKLLESLKK